MTPILLKSSLRYLLKHPWQIGLAILGIALGVAMVVSIDLANASALRAFELSAETVTGRATHQIIGGPTGLDEALYRRLRLEQGVRESAPLVEGYASAIDAPGLTLHIMGIDPLVEAPFRPYLALGNSALSNNLSGFFTTPGAALLPASTAQSYGIQLGDRVPLAVGTQQVEATIIGLLETQDDASRNALDGLLVVDIATAQEWLGLEGRLSSIDLLLPNTPAGQALAERIAATLPPGAILDRPAQRTQSIQAMTDAFEVNLSALSMLALVVGMFLIYNTVTFSVVQRRGLFGTLRCLGVTRNQIFVMTLSEAVLVGLIGALCGLGLGIVLGRGLIGLVSRTINDLYFTVTVRDVAISTWPLIKGFVLGIIATLAAATVPALEATSTPPRSVMRRSSFEERVRKLVPLAAVGGLLLLALGVGMMAIPSKNLILSFGGLFATTIGGAALTPMATLLFMQLLRPMLGRLFGLLGRMASRDVIASLSRTSVAIAALMISVAVMIGVGLMVGSFRYTVVRWLDSSLRSDVYVAAPSLALNRLSTPLPPALIERIGELPGVTRVRRHRSVTVESPNGPTILMAEEMDERDHQLMQLTTADHERIWSGFEQGTVLVSEPLAYRLNLNIGDTVALYTDQGEQRFLISGIYYDYGSDQGVVLMSLETYRRFWNDESVTSIGLDVAQGYEIEQVIRELRNAIGTTLAPNQSPDSEPIQIRSNRALRESSLEVFDRTFAITNVLQLLATIVAFVGILAALMALQLERSRELGMLRANGLTPGQLWGVVMSQTGLMGLTAGLLSIPMGIGLALVLVYVINKRSFGWTLLFQPDPWLFTQALLVAVSAALLAGLYPAWRMSRTSPALALREE